MLGGQGKRVHALVLMAAAGWALTLPAIAATKTVDLDGQAGNGSESQCDLNVLQTFPVKIENKVTNKALGNAFDFRWPSAGPGGFTSSVSAGTTGGVGAKWTWTTNESVYTFTGSTCAKDICFFQTAGNDPIPETCSLACLADGTTLRLARGASADQVSLTWSGGQASFTVYRSQRASDVVQPANAITTTDQFQYTDVAPGGIVYYVVRGLDCTQRKACASDADCNPVTDGTCISRGPFGAPGRSLLTNDVTVSSASLTSSLITFFSPPTEVFRATSTAQPGGYQETLTNGSTTPVTVTTEPYPPGCCPVNPSVPEQLRCGEICVDFLNDPLNCGGCGIVCGEGACCSDGRCASLCEAGRTWCDGQCVDFANDDANCGACGTVCGEGTCCNDGVCASVCDAGEAFCDGLCADVQDDSANCGACGNACSEGTCCNGGACVSLCAEGQTWCDGRCVDFANDSANCGTCGNVCGDGTCCNDGVCASVCDAGEAFCDGLCADVQDDSANCGACGNVCGDGTCCQGGVCVSVCAAGQTWCNGQCVDFANDSANCGACGTVCGAGTCCNDGACVSVCDAGQTWCNGQCVDFANDSANCGACGTVCGEGTCCDGGACVSTCAAGRTYCDGLCYDLQNDPNNCGACGNVCPGDSVCSYGVCSPCDGRGGAKWACDNRCTNLKTDPFNCGTCGRSCNDECPSNFKGVCSNGESCNCVEGTPPPPPPPNTPPPVPPECPNPDPSTPVAGVCPNPDPSSPVAGVCPNPDPSPGPAPGACPNLTPTSPVEGVCPNPEPSPGPVAGVCPNPDPSTPVPGACPDNGLPPPVGATPNCTIEGGSTTIPPGATVTICRPGGLVFKEVATVVRACGDSLPGPDGLCGDGVTNVSEGTFMRLVPDTSVTVGSAFITPFAVHVSEDTSGDGMLQPGESASLFVDVLNAGPEDVTGANALLVAPTVDLTDDGVVDPVGITVTSGSSSYGTVPGTVPPVNCEPPVLAPATNEIAFRVTVPPEHPGDSSHPLSLQFSGSVDGGAFAMDVPFSLGIADVCVAAAGTRDYDGLDGLLSPMAKLVPAGDPVPFPGKPFSAGNTRPLKLRVFCGGVGLGGDAVDAPEIVALSEATRGPLNVADLDLNDDNSANPDDPYFRFGSTAADGQHWIFNMRTSQLGTGRFTITIRIAGRKDYVTGFVLQ